MQTLHHVHYGFWNRRCNDGNAEAVLAMLKWVRTPYG